MTRRDPWAPYELAAFFAAVVDTRLEAAWHLIAFAGTRLGEVLALRWGDVDEPTGCIRVQNAVVGVPYAALAAPATAAHARTIELDRDLAASLSRHDHRQQAERSEWGAGYTDHDLVICHENGETLHPRDLERKFSRVLEREGLRPMDLSALRRSCHVAASSQDTRA